MGDDTVEVIDDLYDRSQEQGEATLVYSCTPCGDINAARKVAVPVLPVCLEKLRKKSLI